MVLRACGVHPLMLLTPHQAQFRTSEYVDLVAATSRLGCRCRGAPPGGKPLPFWLHVSGHKRPFSSHGPLLLVVTTRILAVGVGAQAAVQRARGALVLPGPGARAPGRSVAFSAHARGGCCRALVCGWCGSAAGLSLGSLLTVETIVLCVLLACLWLQ